MESELRDRELVLRSATEDDLEPLWRLLFEDLTWQRFDGPYYRQPNWTLEEFRDGFFQKMLDGRARLLIEVDGVLVGTVNCYWVDEVTRWLEIGVVLYSPESWGKRIGRRALRLWVSHLFEQFEIEHIGLTTWSGNPRMIRTAQSIGMQVEGRIPKVRYFEGEYHDSVKLGVLREDWHANP